MEIPYAFVDAFIQRPLAGNPIAIVPHAETLDEPTMQRIAGELNQAATTFILPPKNGSADRSLRSFTATGEEIFGAGHNSLGAWWWLAESGDLTLDEGRNYFAPSYYIEGLLYNVPDEKFSNCLGDTFCDAINWIQKEADKTKFLTANEQYYLLRDGAKTCWSPADGEAFINAAIELWKNW
jgi:hypothetical protein